MVDTHGELKRLNERARPDDSGRVALTVAMILALIVAVIALVV